MKKLWTRLARWFVAVWRVGETGQQFATMSKRLAFCADCSCVVYVGEGTKAVQVDDKVVCKFCSQRYVAKFALARRRKA